MKRIDVRFLLLQAVILVAVSAIIGIIVSAAMGDEELIAGGFRLMPLFLFFIALMYIGLGNAYTGTIARKTMEKHSKKENFGKCSTFVLLKYYYCFACFNYF